VPGTIFDLLQTEFATSGDVITLLASVTFYIYASLQIVAGSLVDKFGSGKIVKIGGIGMAAGALIFPLSGSVFTLFISRILVGLGTSLIFISMAKKILELFSGEQFIIYLGWALFIGYLGGLAATWPLEQSVKIFGWRSSFFIAGVASTVFVAASCIFIKDISHSTEYVPLWYQDY
jgi:MFS family permease